MSRRNQPTRQSGWDLAALVLAVLLLALAFPAVKPAEASDPLCQNPVTPTETAVCDDPYLLGLEIQINNVLYEWIALDRGELSEAEQMSLGHHMIAREECGDQFRCIESVMRDYLDELHQSYLEGSDTVYDAYSDVPFAVHQSQDSPGNDIIAWNDPQNFGWSERLCQLRCAAEERCVAVGFDTMQQTDGPPGYCLMKDKVELPLKNWTPSGTLSVRQ